MTKLDDKALLQCRERALNAALATHESQPLRTADETVATAKKFSEFLAGSADDAYVPPITVTFRAPTGMPDDWAGEVPTAVLDCVTGQEVTTDQLRERRRGLLVEIEWCNNALKARGVVPC